MPVAADSDNESVLSSLPSSTAADEDEQDGNNGNNGNHEQEQEQVSLSEEDEEEDDDEDEEGQQSDAETEPLPPTSSAARARFSRKSGNGKRRAILQTESSSSEPEVEQGGSNRRRRDTLTVPSGSSLPPAHSPKSRRMSFDDGSDLSALTSEAEDGAMEEVDEDDEDDHRDSKSTKRNVIGQQQQRLASSSSHQQQHEDDNDDDFDRSNSRNEDSTSMDEDGGDDADESDRNARASSRGRGRGRPPKKRIALAAAAKRMAMRNSSRGASAGRDEDSDGALIARDYTKKPSDLPPFDTDDTDLTAAENADNKASTSLTAKVEQHDSTDFGTLPNGGSSSSRVRRRNPDDQDTDIDHDDQLARDMMADEAEELAKAARALDDSDDEDYHDPSSSKARMLQHLTSSRRRGQIHQGTAKNATRRARAASPPASNSNSTTNNNATPKRSPTSKNNKTLSSTNGQPNHARKRGGTAKRGAAGRAAAAARRTASSAKLETEDDDDEGEDDDEHMDMDSHAHLSDEASDSDATPRKDREQGLSNGATATITVTDVNGETEQGSIGSFMGANSATQPGAVAALAPSGAALDADDAMSAMSEEVPLLLRASEQAQAQAQASADSTAIPRLSISTALAEAGVSGGNTPLSRDTPEDDVTAPSTPLLPVPPMGAAPNSAGRKKSPAPEGARGRGRGRAAFGRGRGKNFGKSRMLAAGDEDGEVSTSAAEDGHDREGSPGHETGIGSDHEEDTGDASAAKKRQEAIDALTKIEIEFARLRDNMYLEKMDEIAKERWQIENDVHPEHIHLIQLIEQRRTAKLELAQKVFHETEVAHMRSAEAGVRYCWSQWLRGRHDLLHGMVDDMNQKRRRLDREKRAIERPRSEELSTILRIHAPPPYMFFEKKHPLAYGREYSLEYEVAESMQKKRKRGAVGLDHDEAMYDLERMGLRDPYRGTYPPHYHYDPAYAVGPPSAGPSRSQPFLDGARPGYSGYPYDGSHPSILASQPPYPLPGGMHSQVPSSSSPSNNPLAAAQGRTVASVSQQAPAGIGGRSDPFSAYRMQTPTNVSSSAGPPGSMHIQSQQQHMRPASGPRPTLDDHLGYSATGQARPLPLSGSTGQERQILRPGQRFDYGQKPPNPPPGNKFLPSYYAALGVQRT